jgi:hypothetical protein
MPGIFARFQTLNRKKHATDHSTNRKQQQQKHRQNESLLRNSSSLEKWRRARSVVLWLGKNKKSETMSSEQLSSPLLFRRTNTAPLYTQDEFSEVTASNQHHHHHQRDHHHHLRALDKHQQSERDVGGVDMMYTSHQLQSNSSILRPHHRAYKTYDTVHL